MALPAGSTEMKSVQKEDPVYGDEQKLTLSPSLIQSDQINHWYLVHRSVYICQTILLKKKKSIEPVTATYRAGIVGWRMPLRLGGGTTTL